MRKGENMVRDKKLELEACSHRVIIPLYIPNEDVYYQDAFRIFKMCLMSVRKTAISPLKISVISNGSSAIVNAKLFELSQEGQIDELIVEIENIGKINSILKALRTAEERLITITDADVLFLNGWESEVLNIFKVFPKAGMVSPVPVFRTHLRLTHNIWLHHLFSKRLYFRKVLSPEGMTRFANSIGWSRLDLKFKDVIATLKADNTIAVVGNAHFVGTYKREVFQALPQGNSQYQLGGDSEYLYTDAPVIKSGGYKLATYNNYAYHMGNTIESWLSECYNSLKEEKKRFNDFKDIKKLKSQPLCDVFLIKILKILMRYKSFKAWVFKQKGLNKAQIKNFIE